MNNELFRIMISGGDGYSQSYYLNDSTKSEDMYKRRYSVPWNGTRGVYVLVNNHQLAIL